MRGRSTVSRQVASGSRSGHHPFQAGSAPGSSWRTTTRPRRPKDRSGKTDPTRDVPRAARSGPPGMRISRQEQRSALVIEFGSGDAQGAQRGSGCDGFSTILTDRVEVGDRLADERACPLGSIGTGKVTINSSGPAGQIAAGAKTVSAATIRAGDASQIAAATTSKDGVASFIKSRPRWNNQEKRQKDRS